MKLTQEALKDIKASGGKVNYGLKVERKPKPAQDKTTQAIEKILQENGKNNRELIDSIAKLIDLSIKSQDSAVESINLALMNMAKKEVKKPIKVRAKVTERTNGKIDTVDFYQVD